jgi:hypothetical protein
MKPPVIALEKLNADVIWVAAGELPGTYAALKLELKTPMMDALGDPSSLDAELVKAWGVSVTRLVTAALRDTRQSETRGPNNQLMNRALVSWMNSLNDD